MVEKSALISLYHSLGIFSRWQIDNIFLIFPRKQDLTFHANCLLIPRKQDLIFHANCLLRRQFAWNVKSCFLGKIRKNISKCRLLKILPRVLSFRAMNWSKRHKEFIMLVTMWFCKMNNNVQYTKTKKTITLSKTNDCKNIYIIYIYI